MTDTATTSLIKPSDAKSWSLCALRVWLDNKADFELTTVEDYKKILQIECIGLSEKDQLTQQPSQAASLLSMTANYTPKTYNV